jgi:hypothetical protein
MDPEIGAFLALQGRSAKKLLGRRPSAAPCFLRAVSIILSALSIFIISCIALVLFTESRI